MNLARWLLAAMVVVAASGARAIHMSPDGTGQVLIYPYYTAQSAGDRPYNTYISIVNHDALGKALRVRFREGRNGREVASFNLYLQYGDAWAGAIVPAAGGGAAIRTVDESCTAPAFPVDFAPGSVPTLEFTDGAYTGANQDGHGTDRDRMREGYVEVLEMARFGDISPDPAVYCPDFRAGRGAGAFGKPVGNISGTLTLINVADGMDFTVNAVALQDVASQSYYRLANDPYPDFDAAEINKVSAFVQDGKLYRSQWGSGLAAMEAVLSRTTLANEVVLDAGTASSTDWVVTMPTRRFHAGPPRTAPFDVDLLALAVTFAPRDGAVFQYVPDCGFPCPGGWHRADIRAPWAATVLAFRNTGDFGQTVSDALGSMNAWSIALPAGTQNGSAQVDFATMTSVSSTLFTAETTRIADNVRGSETFRIAGLPAVGFMVRTFRNGTLACGSTPCQGNYGGSFAHKGTRILELP